MLNLKNIHLYQEISGRNVLNGIKILGYMGAFLVQILVHFRQETILNWIV
jgi:hypothetical protein